MITLLGVVGDSDVRAKDSEVGKATPLTSPFIEGIYGNLSQRNSAFSIDSSIRSLRSLTRNDTGKNEVLDRDYRFSVG